MTKINETFKQILFIGGISVIFGLTYPQNPKKLNPTQYLSPSNAHIEYVNNDSLPDLVYKTGEIYLQTKEGNFVLYENKLEKEVK